MNLVETTRAVLPGIIQLVTLNEGDGNLLALCGNGSIWELRDKGTEDQVWVQVQVRTK